MKQTRANGFTLLEVAVALVILGWVLSSAIFLVSQYADERIRLRERFLGNQVAWNQLMQEYRFNRGWQSMIPTGRRQEGVQLQAGQEWPFSIEVEAAEGSGLFRYHVTTLVPGSEDDVAGSLSLFLQQTGGRGE